MPELVQPFNFKRLPFDNLGSLYVHQFQVSNIDFVNFVELLTTGNKITCEELVPIHVECVIHH